jgi:hypothetical protein
LRGQRRVVDASVLDAAREESDLPHGADVAQAEQDHGIIPESLCLSHGVGRTFRPLPKDGDPIALVADRDLDQGIGPSGLEWPGRLVLVRASKEVAARHPLPFRGLAEHDRIEMLGLVDQREEAAAPLLRVRQVDPSHERLVREGPGLYLRSRRIRGESPRDGGRGRDRGEEAERRVA